MERQRRSRSRADLWTADLSHPLVQRLSFVPFKLYTALISRMNQQTREAHVGWEVLAKIMGRSVRSARKAGDVLIAARLVRRHVEHAPARAGRRPSYLAARWELLRLEDGQPGILVEPIEGVADDVATPVGVTLLPNEAAAMQARVRELCHGALQELLDARRTRLAEAERRLNGLAARLGRVLTGQDYARLFEDAVARRTRAAHAIGREPRPMPDAGTLRQALEVVGGASAVHDPLRVAHSDAYQTAIQAQAAWVSAGRAVLTARAELDQVLAQIRGELPRGRDWRKTMTDARWALWLAESADELADAAGPRIEDAAEGWGALPKRPPPRPPAPAAIGEDLDGPKPADPASEWWPPARWARREGASAARWWAMRDQYEALVTQGSTEAVARIRREGFRPDWPDPPR